jgi:hypothetical protein
VLGRKPVKSPSEAVKCVDYRRLQSTFVQSPPAHGQMDGSTALSIYREEKARALQERRISHAQLMAEAKEAFAKMLADAQLARKGGRPKSNPGAPGAAAKPAVAVAKPVAAAPAKKGPAAKPAKKAKAIPAKKAVSAKARVSTKRPKPVRVKAAAPAKKTSAHGVRHAARGKTSKKR